MHAISTQDVREDHLMIAVATMSSASETLSRVSEEFGTYTENHTLDQLEAWAHSKDSEAYGIATLWWKDRLKVDYHLVYRLELGHRMWYVKSSRNRRELLAHAMVNIGHWYIYRDGPIPLDRWWNTTTSHSIWWSSHNSKDAKPLKSTYKDTIPVSVRCLFGGVSNIQITRLDYTFDMYDNILHMLSCIKRDVESSFYDISIHVQNKLDWENGVTAVKELEHCYKPGSNVWAIKLYWESTKILVAMYRSHIVNRVITL